MRISRNRQILRDVAGEIIRCPVPSSETRAAVAALYAVGHGGSDGGEDGLTPLAW